MQTPLIIHTDGSCLGNPGPGGWGAIIQDGKKEKILSGGDPQTTNNRMEMLAVIEAVRWAKKHHGLQRSIKLFSDSSLVVKTFNDGWKQKTNKDLWAQFQEAIEGVKLEIIWVKGHANNELNERCDQIAVAEALKAQKTAPKGSTAPALEMAPGDYRCVACSTTSKGLLGYMPESGMIRVDCPKCRRYIKFAPPLSGNLQRAKERILLTKKEIEAMATALQKQGEPLTDKDLKAIKGMTKKEAEASFDNHQSLF